MRTIVHVIKEYPETGMLPSGRPFVIAGLTACGFRVINAALVLVPHNPMGVPTFHFAVSGYDARYHAPRCCPGCLEQMSTKDRVNPQHMAEQWASK